MAAGSVDRDEATELVPNPTQRAEILLIEDDPQDAFLVEELLAETELDAQITWAATLAEAREALPEFRGCVLLDMNLPDARGRELLNDVLTTAKNAVVVVLTGLDDEHEGIQAVAAGAQDYLVKGQVDGPLLARSMRYAVERQRADEQARQLREAELHARENMRLERGLLPQVLLDRSRFVCHSFYRPGRKRALVGGDFYDAVHRDGTTHIIIGDVSGHGPDEAALGVSMRIAWRALVMGGVTEAALIPALEEILVSERGQQEMYATLCQVSVDDGSDRLRVRLFGHPPPLMTGPAIGMTHPGAVPNEITELRTDPHPPLGTLPPHDLPQYPEAAEHHFPAGSALLLYTDGLLDAHDGSADRPRIGLDGLRQLVKTTSTAGSPVAELPKVVVDAAEQRNGGPLQDDVAMLLITDRTNP
ncbi:fused response regulator/phosphatase [Spiractinospora alimapuensis]|nr:fused response regulator/phosphatase [Spiractinospora alimapuensis]